MGRIRARFFKMNLLINRLSSSIVRLTPVSSVYKDNHLTGTRGYFFVYELSS
jgi:hypothetical protein